MGSRAKRTADDRRIMGRFFRARGETTCTVCGWPATARRDGQDYCAAHVPQEPTLPPD
jgi:hypothetical protein